MIFVRAYLCLMKLLFSIQDFAIVVLSAGEIKGGAALLIKVQMFESTHEELFLTLRNQ